MSEPATIDATPLTDEPLPQTQWLGRWPGTVVSTADPQKLGRVRVRVPQVYGADDEDEFIPDDDLPWALPSMSLHDYHADFEEGDGVWVEFWGGNAAFPIWCGQFLGTGDAPAEFTSSYSPMPKTRILRTTNGHIIEMRWVDGQEQVRIRTAGGLYVNLVDAPALGGPKVEAGTPGLRTLLLSDLPANAVAAIETPSGRVEVRDTPVPGLNVQGVTLPVNISGPAVVVNSTGGPPVVHAFAGNLLINIAGLLAYTIIGALSFAAAGVTITSSAGMVLLVTAGVISLGSAAAKFKLVDTRFFALYDAHTHSGVVPGPGVSGVPVVPATPLIATLSTTNTEAN